MSNKALLLIMEGHIMCHNVIKVEALYLYYLYKLFMSLNDILFLNLMENFMNYFVF